MQLASLTFSIMPHSWDIHTRITCRTPGVFGNTRTSCLTASGDGDGDPGETVGEAFGSAGPSVVDARIGSCRAIFNSPGFLGCDGADSTGLFRWTGAQ